MNTSYSSNIVTKAGKVIAECETCFKLTSNAEQVESIDATGKCLSCYSKQRHIINFSVDGLGGSLYF